MARVGRLAWPGKWLKCYAVSVADIAEHQSEEELIWYDDTFVPRGRLAEMLATAFRPTDQATTTMLQELKRHLGVPVATLGAMLGVPRITARSWLTGKRRPSGAAKKLIWFLHMSAFNRAELAQPGTWLLWGKPQSNAETKARTMRKFLPELVRKKVTSLPRV